MAYPKGGPVTNREGTILAVRQINVSGETTVTDDSITVNGSTTQAMVNNINGTIQILRLCIVTLSARKLKIELINTTGVDFTFYTAYHVGGTTYDAGLEIEQTFGAGDDLELKITDLTAGGAIDVSALIEYRTV